MFGWLRRRRQARAIPDALWQDALGRYPFLAQRSEDELARLRSLSGAFLARKEFHGAQGLAITDAMAVCIAAQACLPLLHLGEPGDPLAALRWYDDFIGIVVHPDEVLARRERVDENGVVHHYDEVLAGESMDQGPAMLSWRDVDAAGESAREGYNVVIHEFAHKIDMRDGMPDGCPPLPSRQARADWLALMQREYEAFCDQVAIAERFGGAPTWLDPYGAEAIDEFFAVACEAYFVNRPRFAQEFPALLPLLDGFFGPAPA